MTKDDPKSDYSLRGKVLGDLSVDVQTSVITGSKYGHWCWNVCASIYTGNGGTQIINTVGFAPDLIWTKALWRCNGIPTGHC